jgi:ABC-type transport system involved in multi-copper enzyme maturation permease subunit
VPIDIASYREWEGHARPTPLATLAIAAAMVRRRMRIRFVRIIIFVYTIVASGAAALVFYMTMQGRGDPRVRGQIRALGLENVDILALLNRLFDESVGFWAVLLAALVGAPLIAEDRRAHALPLYFSRPIGHIEYVLGKALSAAFFLALLLILPRIAMYAVQVGFSDVDGIAWQQVPTLLRGCFGGVLGIVLLTALSLGVSSLTERPTYAAIFLLGLVTVTSGIAYLLSGVLQEPEWLVLSPLTVLHRITLDLMPVPPELSTDTAYIEALNVSTAWAGLAAWTAASLGVLLWRVRRVEVVT